MLRLTKNSKLRNFCIIQGFVSKFPNDKAQEILKSNKFIFLCYLKIWARICYFEAICSKLVCEKPKIAGLMLNSFYLI